MRSLWTLCIGVLMKLTSDGKKNRQLTIEQSFYCDGIVKEVFFL